MHTPNPSTYVQLSHSWHAPLLVVLKVPRQVILQPSTNTYACACVLWLQNPEYTGDDRSYARSLKKTAAGVEYIQLDIKGPVEQQELPQAYLKALSSSSSSAESAAAAAADDAVDDVFLRFSVKWRPRAEGGGAQQVANEISHFKRLDGTWLYFNEVDLA